MDYKAINTFKDNFKNILMDNKFVIVEKKDNHTILKTTCNNFIRIKSTAINDKFETSAYLEEDPSKTKKSYNVIKKGSFFYVMSHTNDALSFLETISNHLKNFENFQKISPFLDSLSIHYDIPNFMSVIYSEIGKIGEKEEVIFFHNIYKELFGKIFYTWDDERNHLIDNYFSKPLKIEPRKNTFHKVLESQIYFEKYIENNDTILNLYSKIKI